MAARSYAALAIGYNFSAAKAAHGSYAASASAYKSNLNTTSALYYLCHSDAVWLFSRRISLYSYLTKYHRISSPACSRHILGSKDIRKSFDKIVAIIFTSHGTRKPILYM